MLRADLQRPGSAEWRLGWASLLTAWLLARVDGAVSAAIPVDETTFAALRGGEDVCGAAGHRLSCLRVTPCADVDGAVPCSASDAVWLPDDYQEQTGQAMLWRELLPLPAGPHPNEDALKASGKRLLCGTSAFFKLPRAVVLYEKPSKPHAQHCSRKFCTIPNELRLLHPTDVAFPGSRKPVSRLGPLARRGRLRSGFPVLTRVPARPLAGLQQHVQHPVGPAVGAAPGGHPLCLVQAGPRRCVH